MRADRHIRPTISSLLSRAHLDAIQPPYKQAAEQLYFLLHEKEDGYLPSARDDLLEKLQEYYPENAPRALQELEKVMRDSIAKGEVIATSMRGVGLVAFKKGLRAGNERLREALEENARHGGYPPVVGPR